MPAPTTPTPEPRLPDHRPCPSVSVWIEGPDLSGDVARAGLEIEWEREVGGSFDWLGPYYDDKRPAVLELGQSPEDLPPYPLLEVNIAAWRVERQADATRHLLEIEWPSFLETGLIFNVDAGICDLPKLVCSLDGCTLSK